jgi:hypothetical protein
MDAKVIVIIVLVVIIIALGVVSFVPFGGKKLFCPAADEAEEIECPEAEECPDSNVATATSCATFVKAATSNLNVNLESYYDDKWCKSKYATLSTESSYCKQISSNITSLVSNVALLFANNGKTLIKKKTGETIEYYYDAAGTLTSPQPPTASLITGTESAATIAAWSTNAKKKTAAQLFTMLDGNEDLKRFQTDDIRGGVVGQLGVIMGLITNYKNVITTTTTTLGTDLTESTKNSYNVLPELWSEIGISGSTYSFLKLDDTNKKAIIAELLKPSISIYSTYCL